MDPETTRQDRHNVITPLLWASMRTAEDHPTEWNVGGRVRITELIIPEALAGLTGTVVTAVGDFVWVDIDDDRHTPALFRGRREIKCPTGSLEAA